MSNYPKFAYVGGHKHRLVFEPSQEFNGAVATFKHKGATLGNIFVGGIDNYIDRVSCSNDGLVTIACQYRPHGFRH